MECNKIRFGDLKVGDQFYRIDRRRCAIARCIVKSINRIGLVCYISYYMNGAAPHHIERMQCLPDSRCLKFDDAYLLSTHPKPYKPCLCLIKDMHHQTLDNENRASTASSQYDEGLHHSSDN